MKCSAIRRNGTPCQAQSLKGGKLCLFHADRSGNYLESLERPMTREEEIAILCTEIRRVRRSFKCDNLRRGELILSLLRRLEQLQGKDPEPEKSSLDKRIEEWQAKKDQK